MPRPPKTDTMATSLATVPMAHPSSHFFLLPLELRREVYQYIFSAWAVPLIEQTRGQRLAGPTSPTLMSDYDKAHQDLVLEATRFLRSNGQYVLDDKISNKSWTAIFRTCREIYLEALPKVFREASIRFSIRARLPLTLHCFQDNLPLLRHLSIDFSYLRFADKNKIMYECLGQKENAIDDEIASCINYIAEKCRSLHTFALHLLSDQCRCGCSNDAVHSSLENFKRHTAKALVKDNNALADGIHHHPRIH